MAPAGDIITLEYISEMMESNHREWLTAIGRVEEKLDDLEGDTQELQRKLSGKRNEAMDIVVSIQEELGVEARLAVSEAMIPMKARIANALENMTDRYSRGNNLPHEEETATATPKRRRNNPTRKQREARRRRDVHQGDGTMDDDHVVFSTIGAHGRERRREKKLALFKGDEEWSAYHAHFEAVSEYNGWDDEDQLAQLATSLGGPALELYADMPTRAKDHLPDLLTALRRRFAPEGREAKYRAQLSSCSRAGEPPDVYAQKMERLVRRAYPGMTTEQREELSLEKFVQGQVSPKLREVMIVAYPKTLNEAVAAVYKHEANARTTGTPRPTIRLNAIQKDEHENESTVKILAEEVARLRAQISARDDGRERPSEAPRGRRHSPDERDTPRAAATREEQVATSSASSDEHSSQEN